MLSPLFIQLFGREVVDRLGLSGFDDADALARTSPEQVSEDAGIPVALARRIVALAVESGDPTPAEEVGAPEAAAPAPISGPESAGEEGRAASGGTLSDDTDAYIDRAGLVSWMGFAARAAGGKGRAWSVDDAILDRGGEKRSSKAPPEESIVAAVESAAPIVDDLPAERRAPMLLPDSLWSFGRFEERPLHGGAARGKPHAERPGAQPHDSQRPDPETPGAPAAMQRHRPHPRRRRRDA